MDSHHSTARTLLDPSTIFYQSTNIRRLIILSYWIVILFSVPLWWSTTSIERLSLPTSRVHSHAHNRLKIPITIHLQNLEGTDFLNSDELQGLVDDRMANPQRKSTWYESLPSQLVDLLENLLAPFSGIPEQEHRVIQYSTRYRLSFTLLNEDAAAGSSMYDWDVVNSIHNHISPILNQLVLLHNFTIESQVQYHAPLAFKPQDLTVFVNSAEWTLSSSSSNDPVLHFIVFIPAASQRPLYILDAAGTPSAANAFLLPQWGGIVLHNPSDSSDQAADHSFSKHTLDSVFLGFRDQLLTLLGVPPLTSWQLESLMRRRSLENSEGAKDTLQSIVKLVEQIENMPVGQNVRDDVQNALTALDELYYSSKTSLGHVLHHSAQALEFSSRAFFNPGMLALLYFPAEHKYAVYTPLFASAVIPLFVAAMREVNAFRKQRNLRRQSR
ncbi:phosphatidylinositol-glycan biosynthesis class S protein-domain-containing protein [Infundibulicybe gibba]|nr:phosphatidylinositol-glycan biosynthesis class S protein-domain-containing protein [Infundibulicybe gibba]